jgi:hypothetical protein
MKAKNKENGLKGRTMIKTAENPTIDIAIFHI